MRTPAAETFRCRNGCAHRSRALALRPVVPSANLLRRSFRYQVYRTGLGVMFVAGCSTGGQDLASRRAGPDEVVDPVDLLEGSAGAGGGIVTELAPVEAHAVLGVDPTHGPFRGGQVALIRGNGFSSGVRVWFGDVEVPAEQVIATRADRIQVSVPPGGPGSVAITTQNADDASTRRSLAAAYDYDVFFAEPDVAPTSGGSIITLNGSGTTWDTATTVLVDRQPCEVLAVRGAPGGVQQLDCRVPEGTEGSKSISVTAAGVTETVGGAFGYEPGEVLRGGFGGEPLAGRLSVQVTAAGGRPVAGAYVIVGSDFDLAAMGQPESTIQQTDAGGQAVFTRDFPAPPLVTVAARCFQPLSFVDVPVDTVRAELSPVASPDCASGSPPLSSGGGAPVRPVLVRGELVWRAGAEFQRSGWTNVPEPQRATERLAAYIFQPTGDAEGRFRLPREDSAITLESPGEAGYAFELVTGGGTRTFYALAGVENRSVSPPRFTAYAMGLLRGVFANPGDIVEGLAIPMDRTLDQAITLDVVGPSATERGPDLVSIRVAVQISAGSFAVLPNALLETPLQGGSGIGLIGVPALVGELEGARYAIGARAVPGSGLGTPLSVLPMITAENTVGTIAVDNFIPVPTLSVGSSAELAWNRELSTSWSGAGREVSLIHYEVRSGAGLITWSIVAPPTAVTFRLPDLSVLPEGDLVPGAIEIVGSLASLPEVAYSGLRSEHMRRGAWEAYAVDVASSRYERSAQ